MIYRSFFKVALLFLIVWQVIPRLVGLALRELALSYNALVINEITILVGCVSFMQFGLWNQQSYGLKLGSNYSIGLLFWPLLLQSPGILGIILMIAFSAPLPGFIYTDSLAEIFLKYILLAPLCEEVFLRGLIQTNLLFFGGSIKIRSIQISSPVIVTALLFGFMHIFPFQGTAGGIKTFISIFILGLIAGYYREKSGSLLPAFITHASYNFWGGFLAKVLYLISK